MILKKSKMTLIVAAICVSAAVSSLSVFAGDKYSEPFSKVETNLTKNKAYANEKLVQVGNDYISKKELLDLKAHKEFEMSLSNNLSRTLKEDDLKEGDLLEELITEKLLLQKAEELNVEATIEDGKKEAFRARDILKKQSKDVQEFQNKVIALTGLSEEEYWKSYAPKLYQEQLTQANLLIKLQKDGVLSEGEDLNKFGEKYREYRNGLYKSSLGNKVKSLDAKTLLNE
ncbi:SurA N-terminal domain-containing protein [Paenibacillus elgii]